MENDASIHWYALKVFYNRVFAIEELLRSRGMQSYIPCETVAVVAGGIRKSVRRTLIPSLMFFRATEQDAADLQIILRGRAMLYTAFEEGGRRPAPISDYEMKMFMLVTSSGDKGLEFFPDAYAAYRVGERVRVTGGLFKGAEGSILRIKHNRRLVVSLKGVCMVATSFIAPCFLERLDEKQELRAE